MFEGRKHLPVSIRSRVFAANARDGCATFTSWIQWMMTSVRFASSRPSLVNFFTRKSYEKCLKHCVSFKYYSYNSNRITFKTKKFNWGIQFFPSFKWNEKCNCIRSEFMKRVFFLNGYFVSILFLCCIKCYKSRKWDQS